MTDKAALAACYSDWKLIKTRSVVQLIFEIPLEASGDAYQALGGMPQPGQEVWCAIARLNRKDGEAPAGFSQTNHQQTPETAPAPASSLPVRARTWDEIPHAQQAGILCQDAKFRRFLAEHDKCSAIAVYDLDTARDRVCEICDVQSRSEIREGTNSEQRWNLLVSAYRAWELAPAVGAA